MTAPPVAAGRFYRLLVYLYPSSFRRQFAWEMACDFDDAMSEAWDEGGWDAVARLWMHTCRDLARSLFAQWLRRAPSVLVLLATASTAICAVAIAQTLRQPFVEPAYVNTTDGDKAVLLFLATMVILIATIVILFTVCFRLLTPRRTARPRRV